MYAKSTKMSMVKLPLFWIYFHKQLKILISHQALYKYHSTPTSNQFSCQRSWLFSLDKPWEKTITGIIIWYNLEKLWWSSSCECVSLEISILGRKHGVKNKSLYQDDRLACLHKIKGPMSEKIRKDVIKTFCKNFGLKITTKKSKDH